MNKAYQLLAHLKHLTLVGQNEEGELEWVGTDLQWKEVEKEISEHESN